MSARNIEWYDLNESRSWPLADQATEIDDSGNRLPHNLIADLNIWFPDTLGTYAYVGSVTVGPNIATITIMGNGVAIGAVSVVAPIDPYRHYPLQALYPGVAGWVVFGSALNEGVLQSYRFSNPQQSLLIPHVARKYRTPPVTGIGKLGLSSALTGVVRLQGGNDIEIVKEEREIDNVVRDVAVIRLRKDDSVTDDTEVLAKYLGPCDTRPESRNCGGEEPIEFINSVAPDCCGNITVEFRGCSDVRFIQNESCSVAVGCEFGLSDACVTQDRLPDEDGRLPNEYADLCIEESVSIVSSEGGDAVWWKIAETEYEYNARQVTPEDRDARLPYVEDFSNQKAEDFSIKLGKYKIIADNELPMFGGFSLQSEGGTRNVAVWDKGIPTNDWSTLFKKATLHFSLRPAPAGTLHNGGIAFNYKSKPNKNYWCAEVDFEGTFTGRKSLRIAKYNGLTSTTYAVVDVTNLAIGLQYQLDLTILPGEGADVWVLAQLTNTEPPESEKFVHATLGPFLIKDYGDSDGLFGLTSYRSVTQFNRLIVDNAENI